MMATETSTTNADELAIENGKLRQQVAELTQKSRDRKIKLSELERQLAATAIRAETAEATVKQALIDAPLKTLAFEVSVTPSLFLEQLKQRYRFELDDKQQLQMQYQDGKPVLGKDDKPLRLEWKALGDFLCDAKAKEANPEDASMFAHIVIASKATGSGAVGGSNHSSFQAPQAPDAKAEVQRPSFGLK